MTQSSHNIFAISNSLIDSLLELQHFIFHDLFPFNGNERICLNLVTAGLYMCIINDGCIQVIWGHLRTFRSSENVRVRLNSLMSQPVRRQLFFICLVFLKGSYLNATTFNATWHHSEYNYSTVMLFWTPSKYILSMIDFISWTLLKWWSDSFEGIYCACLPAISPQWDL